MAIPNPRQYLVKMRSMEEVQEARSVLNNYGTSYYDHNNDSLCDEYSFKYLPSPPENEGQTIFVYITLLTEKMEFKNCTIFLSKTSKKKTICNDSRYGFPPNLRHETLDSLDELKTLVDASKTAEPKVFVTNRGRVDSFTVSDFKEPTKEDLKTSLSRDIVNLPNRLTKCF